MKEKRFFRIVSQEDLMIYLDNAATTPPMKEALLSLQETLFDYYANPSSLHSAGFRTAALREEVRQRAADLIGTSPGEVIFNSGATEGNNTVLRGITPLLKRGKAIALTSIGHASVEKTAQALEREGAALVRLPLKKGGTIDLDRLDEAVGPSCALLSVNAVNNETGLIQPLDALIRRVRAIHPDILIHVDAVQSFWSPLWEAWPALDWDFLTLSAHKIHALKGTGLLIIRKGRHLHPLLSGGEQEHSFRPGTENMPGIIALGLVLKQLRKNRSSFLGAIRLLEEAFIKNLADLGDYALNREKGASYSPHILSLSHESIPGAVLQNALSEKGICVSTGSACSDRDKKSHRVLTASGYEEKQAGNTIRVSLSPFNTPDEVTALVNALDEISQTVGALYRRVR